MAKRKSRKGQTTIYKTSHIKLKIEKHEPLIRNGENERSCICVFGVLILPLSTTLILYFETVATDNALQSTPQKTID
jgi:hypothetical protein